MPITQVRAKNVFIGRVRQWWIYLSGALIALFSVEALAGDVSVEFARFDARGGGDWQVSVTLRHADTGWDHYADAWRVVTEDGSIIGTRTLFHPHVDEQPFTRSLSGLRLPADVTRVYVEAHDKVHGWSADRVEVDLNLTSGDRFEVAR